MNIRIVEGSYIGHETDCIIRNAAGKPIGYPIAAILHVLPRGAADGVVPKGNRMIVGVTFAIGVALATLIVSTKPDTQHLIDHMPIWLRDYWQTGAVPQQNVPS